MEVSGGRFTTPSRDGLIDVGLLGDDMPVPIADLSMVTEQILADLVGIAESETLEFKLDTYGTSDRAK
jgi:hypothetical protein